MLFSLKKEHKGTVLVIIEASLHQDPQFHFAFPVHLVIAIMWATPGLNPKPNIQNPANAGTAKLR